LPLPCPPRSTLFPYTTLFRSMLTLVVSELIITGSFVAPSEKRRVQQRKSSGDSRIGRLLIFAPAAGAGLLMAFSRTLWSYATIRSEEHTSELQSRFDLVCRLL